jgi:hypothetical protein
MSVALCAITADPTMFERRGKQCPHPCCRGSPRRLSALPVLKTLKWQWNLFYCYIYLHLYNTYLSLLCKHDSLHKKWTVEQYVNTTAHNTCWSEWFRPMYAERSVPKTRFGQRGLRHSKMQPQPLILQNTERQLCPKKNITGLVIINYVPHQKDLHKTDSLL